MSERRTTAEAARRASATGRESLRKRDESSADVITSRDNRWLKEFRQALRGKGPEQGEPIGLEGPKLIQEAIRAGLETEALLVSGTGEQGLQEILQTASESDS